MNLEIGVQGQEELTASSKRRFCQGYVEKSQSKCALLKCALIHVISFPMEMTEDLGEVRPVDVVYLNFSKVSDVSPKMEQQSQDKGKNWLKQYCERVDRG